VITAELFSSFCGCHTQHQSLIVIGQVHEDFEYAAKVACPMYDTGTQALRPGRKLGDLVKEMVKPTQRASD